MKKVPDGTLKGIPIQRDAKKNQWITDMELGRSSKTGVKKSVPFTVKGQEFVGEAMEIIQETYGRGRKKKGGKMGTKMKRRFQSKIAASNTFPPSSGKRKPSLRRRMGRGTNKEPLRGNFGDNKEGLSGNKD